MDFSEILMEDIKLMVDKILKISLDICRKF